MCGSKYISLFPRLLQLLLAALVLGLSINAILWQYYGSVPAINGFGAFVGAFGCFVAVIGLVTICVGGLSGFFMPVVDAVLGVLFLAGGIAFAVGLNGTDCTDGDYWKTWLTQLISGGCIFLWDENEYQCGFFTTTDIERRCRLAKADAAFMFLGCVVSLITAVLVYRGRKRMSGTATA